MIRLLSALLFALLLSSSGSAQDMKLTIYDDGMSCPGGCDSHVVMNRADNGTRAAFRPDSQRSAPQPCVAGELCRICFGSADVSCMTAMYRGGGPPRGTFDFTPAFYEENCGRQDIPEALKQQCALLDRAVQQRGYDTRINCFDQPDDSRCQEVIDAALAAQEADRSKFDQCRTLGQEQYNAQQSDAAERRALDCSYSEARLGGPNSQGVRWRLLLPGACRPGTLVGGFGTDCCSADVRLAASLHPECSKYFPRP